MPSFDIVSNTDLAEVDNALQGVLREIATRFDFKGSACTIERQETVIVILADDATKLRQIQELVKGYFVRRKLDPRCLDWQTEESAAGGKLRQKVTIQQGIEREIAAKIVRVLKDSKIKVQSAIQGDELRISGKKRDDLQAAIAAVRAMNIDLPLQYINFRD
ncbi:MAG: YajQ family cyclic di-GMP-binding protein [Rhodospirillales bacterium]|nr:YajQ family cyclic di-GMP-binding protein [Rhodospirillales bacterium]